LLVDAGQRGQLQHADGLPAQVDQGILGLSLKNCQASSPGPPPIRCPYCAVGTHSAVASRSACQEV
jgi:hypothetical protein